MVDSLERTNMPLTSRNLGLAAVVAAGLALLWAALALLSGGARTLVVVIVITGTLWLLTKDGNARMALWRDECAALALFVAGVTGLLMAYV